MKKVRYAVIGLGDIAQTAVLPGFKGARKNSTLTALISGDSKKLKVLGKKYNVSNLYSYDQYDEFLQAKVADAVYIALPNNQHAEFSVKAANAGLHVLCEKPMASTEAECQAMIDAAKKNNVLLMIAYRLHFDAANLEAIQILRSGRIGDVRIFNSVFSQQVETGDIRLQEKLAGGTLWDMGIYCINAARYLFGDEPTQAMAISARGTGPRFREVDEMTSAVLRFPHDRFAIFTSSFGAAHTSSYEVIGTKGGVRLDPAYGYATPLAYHLTLNGKTRTKKFPKHDQFGAELIYFSNCILSKKAPEPSGEEGLNDVKIIRALYRAAETGKIIPLEFSANAAAVQPTQKITLPPVKEPEIVSSSHSK